MEGRDMKRERSSSRERDRSRRSERHNNSSSGRDRSPISKKGGPADRRVYVSNIAYEFRWQELKDLFREKVGEVSFVELFVDENDKPRGCGIVEFSTPELAQKAVEKMHRYELRGRKLVVKEDTDVERDKQGRPLGFGGRSVRSNERGGGGGGGSMNSRSNWNDAPMNNQNSAVKYGNTYGLSPQFLESLWIQGPLTNKVFVANLDYKVDEKKLREVFKLAGKIVDCELSVDKEGKSRGFGVVEYDHPVEAVQAISMLHNQTLYERRLIVRLDRVDKGDQPPKLPEGLKGIGMGLGANGAPLTDVSRNLPNINQPSISSAVAQNPAVPTALAALVPFSGTNPAVALAANQLGTGTLGGLGSISNLIGAAAAANNTDLTSALISNNYTGGLASLAGANPAAAASALSSSLLSNSAFGNAARGGLGAGGNRDFDSLSAAYNNSERDYRSGNPAGPGSVFSSALGGGGMDRGNGVADGLMPSRRTDTVVVSNLPAATTWQLLKDKFCTFGDIKFAEMRTKDCGIIRFSNEWEAERAINMMDRARFDGRTISVQYF